MVNVRMGQGHVEWAGRSLRATRRRVASRGAESCTCKSRREQPDSHGLSEEKKKLMRSALGELHVEKGALDLGPEDGRNFKR